MRYAQHFATIPMHTNNHLFLLCLLHLTCVHNVSDYWDDHDDITTIFMTTLHKAIWTLLSVTVSYKFQSFRTVIATFVVFFQFISSMSIYILSSVIVVFMYHASDKSSLFGIITLQLVILILIYNSKNYYFVSFSFNYAAIFFSNHKIDVICIPLHSLYAKTLI